MFSSTFKIYLCEQLRQRAIKVAKKQDSLVHDPLQKWGNIHLKELYLLLQVDFSHSFLRRLFGLDSKSIRSINKENKTLIMKALAYASWEKLESDFWKEQQTSDLLVQFQKQAERLANIESLLNSLLEKLK